jgi:hypothetical protein
MAAYLSEVWHDDGPMLGVAGGFMKSKDVQIGMQVQVNEGYREPHL